MSWSVIAEPLGQNPGPLSRAVSAAKDAVGAGDAGNTGGMVIYVTDGSNRQEVSRVAWVRRNSKNPKVSFDKQLAAEIDKARTAISVLNEQLAGAGGGLQ